MTGSSPHTWGIRAPGSGRRCSKRFIPTYVGHTDLPVRASLFPPVHPHIRGAYCKQTCETAVNFGSSPHTWGILYDSSFSPHFQRFIPTYVGHTPVPGWHPGCRRFIPTYVGHTLPQYTIHFPVPVHPHIRGAYDVPRPAVVPKRGSSPHTWGIHWTTVRKMAGFSHFSYDFTRKSYFVQGLVFFGVIGAEAFPTHRRGRNQCLPGAHGGSVRNL